MTKPKGILPFDDYDFETLIVPTLVLASPVIALAAYLGFSMSPWLGVAVFGVELIAVPFIATNAIIRNAGKKLEKETFKGIMPTTRLLLANGSNVKVSRAHNRRIIEEVSGVKLLSVAAEKAESEKAKHTIDTAINIVKEKLRGDFVLRRELKSYGYWRNILAMRTVGRNLSLCITLVSSLLFLKTDVSNDKPEYGYVLVLLVSGLVWLYWVYAVNIESYRNSAIRYAEQFFKSATSLK